MLEQATFLSPKLEFENMVMSMLLINPAFTKRRYVKHSHADLVHVRDGGPEDAEVTVMPPAHPGRRQQPRPRAR